MKRFLFFACFCFIAHQVFSQCPPPPTASDTTICARNPARLTASGVGTLSWWDAPSGGTQLSADTVYTTPPLDTVTAFYVDATANGCTSARTKVTVRLNPLPTGTAEVNGFPGQDTVYMCLGAGLLLFADPNPPTPTSDAISWYWTGPGGFVATGKATSAGLVRDNGFGIYQVSFKGANGCVDSSKVAVLEIPFDTVTISRQGNTLFAVTADTGIFEWVDSAGNGLGVGAQYTPLESGKYYVRLFKGGCYTTSGAYDFFIAGMQQSIQDRFIAYPNPVGDWLIIETGHPAQLLKLHVTDLNGRRLITQNLDARQTHLDVSEWARGIYVWEIYSADGNVVDRGKLTR